MSFRQTYAFRPIRGTTAPSFEIGATNVFASTSVALQSTALGRIWAGAHGRTLRFAEDKGVDYHFNLGDSSVVAASSDSILVLGGTVEEFHVEPGLTHLAVASVSTSTGARVNVTLGYGQ